MDSAGQNPITSDVIAIDSTLKADGSEAKITGVRPGTAWVRVAASGTLNGSPVSKVKDIKIKVTGELEAFSNPRL